MPVRAVLQYPHPLLTRPARALAWSSELARATAADLEETLESFPHAVGLAAPQIGQDVRMIVVDAARGKPNPNHGRHVLINPEIVAARGAQTLREGCLSLPDFVARVRRHRRVTVTFTDLSGQPGRWEAEGFEAVVLQHEIDHLDGILFIDRITSSDDLVRRE